MLTREYTAAPTKHCSPVEVHALENMMSHGKHTDTEKQQYMFHFAGSDLWERGFESKSEFKVH